MISSYNRQRGCRDRLRGSVSPLSLWNTMSVVYLIATVFVVTLSTTTTFTTNAFVPTQITTTKFHQTQQQYAPSFKTFLKSTATTAAMLPEGLVKTVTKNGNDDSIVNLGDIVTVKYSCYTSSDSSDSKPFAKATKQKMVCCYYCVICCWMNAPVFGLWC